MVRIQFDREHVINKSIDLFWQHGFHASSMQQVIQVTGLKPGSIYLAFGSKEGLYREALHTYAKNSLEKIKNTLDKAPTIGDGVCDMLEGIVQESASADYCSCFVIKTQLELAAEGGELYDFTADKLVATEALLRSYLEQEYDANICAARATSLMLHIFGLRVYGYQQASIERMHLGLCQGLPWLPWRNRMV